MKKVLVLSALGCVATVGAVFAAFTLDPTNVSEEITNTDIEVDLSSRVFSTFELTNKFNYIDPTSGKDLYEDVPVTYPKYQFKSDTIYGEGGTIDGTTLGLHVKEPYTYDSFLEYLEWRADHPKPQKEEELPAWEAENLKLAPKGYAFKYEYDENFIQRIKQDDIIPESMQKKENEWQYPIYKTNFSSGLTSSKFTKAGLATFGIGYEDPDPTNPIYKDFTWDKEIDNPDSEWYLGGDGFFIQPDVVEDSETGKLKHLNKGTIIFTGVEMTDDLFTGQFADEDTVKACEAYLNEKDAKEAYIHRDFSLKVKATEYFKVTKCTLEQTTPRAFAYDPKGEPILTQNRYSFSFTATDDTEELFKEGYQIDKLVLIDGHNNTFPLLEDDASPVSELALKVTKTSQNGNATETDITSSFAYSNDQSDKDYYHTIHYVGSTPLTLVKGDVVTFNFIFEKDHGSEAKLSWAGAAISLAIPVKGKYVLVFDGDNNQYLYDAKDTPISLAKGELHRFEIPFDNITKKYNDRFTLKDSENNIVPLNSDIVSIHIRGSNGYDETLKLDEDYTIDTDGTITFDPFLVDRYGINQPDYQLDVDITNNKDAALSVKTATLTCYDIEQPVDFGDNYTKEKDEPTSSGYIQGDTPATLTPGKMYNFTVPVATDTKFFYAIKNLVSSADLISNIRLGLTIFDSETTPAPIPLASGELKFYISRTSNDLYAKPMDDTDSYVYDSIGKTIVCSRNDVTYCKEIENGATSGYVTLNIKFVYSGATEVTNAKTSRLDLVVTPK